MRRNPRSEFFTIDQPFVYRGMRRVQYSTKQRLISPKPLGISLNIIRHFQVMATATIGQTLLAISITTHHSASTSSYSTFVRNGKRDVRKLKMGDILKIDHHGFVQRYNSAQDQCFVAVAVYVIVVDVIVVVVGVTGVFSAQRKEPTVLLNQKGGSCACLLANRTIKLGWSSSSSLVASIEKSPAMQ